MTEARQTTPPAATCPVQHAGPTTAPPGRTTREPGRRADLIARLPGRSLLTWALAFGIPGTAIRRAARRGDLTSLVLTDPRLRADPFPSYDQLRAAGAVVRGSGIFSTTDHAAADHILRSDAFGVAEGHGELPLRVRRIIHAIAEPGALGPLEPPSMLATDPPAHTRYRRLVSRVFTPRAARALEPMIDEVATDLLDRLERQSEREFDLVAQYAARLPVAAISKILGLPQTMEDQILRWGDGAAAMLDPGLTWRQYRASRTDVRELSHWFDNHVAALRRDPGDDLLSRLARLEGDDRLSDIELRATGLLILGAGFETTVNLIGNAVALLDRHPEQLDRLRNDPALWPNAVEEVLRMESPVQMTVRQAYRDTTVLGTRMKPGTAVVVFVGGANRDPAVFTNPHEFDIGRQSASEHLAFSAGVHYCLGAGLAKTEAGIALRRLYERFPDLTLQGPAIRRPTKVLRGYTRLPVRAGKPAA
ncbi:cytochrome P450 [Streptomyces sp. NPDC059193]|uniref:cytochrome P450 n=1 Tax=Streptomyces sp. NPDC059193 TaxID=3346763 RepID=UPI0036A84750